MISARGPDSASADDVRAPLLRVARQTPSPLHQVSASFGGGRATALLAPRPPFPSGLLPSGIGMAKPTIQQARDRAEWLAISVRATPLTFTARRSNRRQQSPAQRVARDQNPLLHVFAPPVPIRFPFPALSTFPQL